MLIRPAAVADIHTITAIYSHWVVTSAATFEVEPPGEPEMLRRWQAIAEAGLPFLVAEQEGEVAGYAYATLYRPRAAYRFTVEDSIYLDPAHAGKGIGRRLLAAVIEGAARQGYRQMIAVIGDSANLASIRLHEALGFERVGVLGKVGFKFGRWVDTVLMQRELQGGDVPRPEGLPEPDQLT